MHGKKSCALGRVPMPVNEESMKVSLRDQLLTEIVFGERELRLQIFLLFVRKSSICSSLYKYSATFNYYQLNVRKSAHIESDNKNFQKKILFIFIKLADYFFIHVFFNISCANYL